MAIMLEGEESKLLFTETNTENLVRKISPILDVSGSVNALYIFAQEYQLLGLLSEPK